MAPPSHRHPAPVVLALWAVAWLAACSDRDVAPATPDIVVIVSDDAGYADFGFQGSGDIRTRRPAPRPGFPLTIL